MISARRVCASTWSARAGDQRGDELVVVVVLDAQIAFASASDSGSTAGRYQQNRTHVSSLGASNAPRRMSAHSSLCLSCMLAAPALAVTGNAPPAAGWAARPIVMLVDARDDLCTGTALARDLVLTAAHCVRGRSTTRSRPTRPA